MHIMPRRRLTKPLPYIKALAKNIKIEREQTPDWEIFQIVGVVQRLMRRRKAWIPYID